jgi:putative tricarboxylic transport membrane protein
MIENLLHGFQLALDPNLLMITFLAVLGGFFIGALPGLTATMGVAILVPLTFNLPPQEGLLILMAIFISAVQGGSVSAILINTPGTPAAAATGFDGYPMAQKGLAGQAIGTAQISSFCGCLIGWVFLITASPLIVKIALKFSAPEYFALAVFGLTMVVSLATESLLKGVLAALFGLLLASIGIDPVHGTTRFTFGLDHLLGGISYIPALIGLFAISEALLGMERAFDVSRAIQDIKFKVIPPMADLKRCTPTIARSGLIGTFIGSLPGVGADVAAFVAYGEAKRWSKHKEEFGKGNPEGISAAETANNAVCGGAMIPMLTLGVPGDAVTAVILGALIMWGIRPGDQLFTANADLVYTLFAGFLIAAVITVAVGLSLARYFARVLVVPKTILLPIIFILCIVGSYSVNTSVFDVYICIFFGILGYFMIKAGFQGSPIVLALILGPMAEDNFRRALQMSHGDYSIFFTQPISLAFLCITAASVAFSLWRGAKAKSSAQIKG